MRCRLADAKIPARVESCRPISPVNPETCTGDRVELHEAAADQTRRGRGPYSTVCSVGKAGRNRTMACVRRGRCVFGNIFRTPS